MSRFARRAESMPFAGVPVLLWTRRGDMTGGPVMLWNSNPDSEEEKWTPIVIGAFAVVMIAVGFYMNFGYDFFHPRTATDISATTSPKPAE